ATDINREFLTRAAEGKFRAWALRSTPAAVQRDCFSQDGLTWTIHPQYKQSISFRHMNLIDREFSTPAGEAKYFDLILCRNVMIYFSPETNRRIVGNFHQSLEEGGWLVVGAAEHNLENYRAFATVSDAGMALYQKAAPKCVALEPPVELKTHVRENPPQKPRAPLTAKPPASPDRSDMEKLRQLADSGHWQAASEQCRHMLTLDPLNAESHYYQALIFENLAKTDEAERSLRQALYLDRNFALAHYHLGLALKREGKAHAATKSFGNVLSALTGVANDATLLAGHGVTAIRLKELAQMQLEVASPS
ncbi:MAG: CheR family methyltransferase, partial [Bryobacteraceae bacterium]